MRVQYAGNLPYRSFNEEMRSRYGAKVYRVPIDAGFTCPNRDGTVATGGCTYCDDIGSGPGTRYGNNIQEQIKNGIEAMRRNYKAERFIAYFQAFSNTYAPVDVLRRVYDQALCDDRIVAMAIATRPDCVGTEVVELLVEYSKKIPIWIELGLQSINNETLRKVNRGHTVEDFVEAVHRLHQAQLEICAHVVLGFPDDSYQDMLGMADLVANLQVSGVKLHQLYFIQNTPMADLYTQGKVQALSLEHYIDLVIQFVEKLSPKMTIHRLMGDTTRDQLVAPLWALEKEKFLTTLHQEFAKRQTYQGKWCMENNKYKYM